MTEDILANLFVRIIITRSLDYEYIKFEFHSFESDVKNRSKRLEVVFLVCQRNKINSCA